MRKIKFRGRTFDGKLIYGDFVHVVPQSSFPGIIDDDGFAHEVETNSVEQFTNCYDANGEEIYDGDEIRIDYEGAAKVIGEGMLLRQIEATKPTDDAKLKIKWEHYRYRLVWCTPNGRVDTGVDMALLEPILPYVEVA